MTGLLPINPPRALRSHERALIEQLLRAQFEGCTEIRSQLAVARVDAEGHGDTRTLRFTLSGQTVSRAQTVVRIPVEAETVDDDGVPIAILLHVVDGYAQELEIYRVDGERIRRAVLDSADSVAINDE